MKTRRTRTPVAALSVGFTALSLAAVGVCCSADVQQTSPPPTEDSGMVGDGGDADASPSDADGNDLDQASADGTFDCTASPATWPGWKDLETPTCCELAVPSTLSTAVHDLSWHACAGAPSCQELDMSALGLSSPRGLFKSGSSRGPDGKPVWLLLGVSVDTDTGQWALYDWATSSPVAAWRSRLGSRCAIHPIIVGAGRNAALLEITYPDLNKWLADGDPATLSTAPLFQSVSGSEVADIQDVALSDTTFAFDLPLSGRILRMAIGSEKYVLSPATGFPALLMDFVEGDDVFALSEHGTTGYGQEWRIDPDGTPVVVRAKDGRHMCTFATDGTTLFWTEIFGSTDFFATMTREVWAAPYSTDPATLDASAKRVAAIPDGHISPRAIAYGGIYAVESVANGLDVFVVRLSDGATQTVSDALGFQDLVYVSDTELWATTGAGTLRRYSLATW